MPEQVTQSTRARLPLTRRPLVRLLSTANRPSATAQLINFRWPEPEHRPNWPLYRPATCHILRFANRALLDL